MKPILAMLVCLALLSGSALAAEPTEKDAIAMVDKAVAYAKANGRDKLVAEVNAKNPEFMQGELYVVVVALDGTRLAHPVNAKLVGKPIQEMVDVDGKEFGKEYMALLPKGKGWVDYKFKNPVTGKIEPKTTYLFKSTDFFALAGIYK